MERIEGKRFALIGAAGYVAPKHMKAIKDIGGDLVAVLDPHDSVGILDSFFPECRYFREFERFDRFIDLMRRTNSPIDYVSICSPNYMHDSHCRWALRSGINAICEKPVVLNMRNLEALMELERETGARVFPIFQLRHHPEAINAKILNLNNYFHEVKVKYITPRGPWYKYSWKGDQQKSGGIAINIGIHLFDLASYFFGKHEAVDILVNSENTCYGYVSFKNAIMSFFLSTASKEDLTPQRKFIIDCREIDFSTSFHELHSKMYEAILAGNGLRLSDAENSLLICEAIKNWKK